MVAGGVVVVVVGAVVAGVVVVGLGVVVVGATVVVGVVLAGLEVVVVGATVEVLTDEVEPVLLQAAIKGSAISSTAAVRIRVRFMFSSNNLILNDFTYEVKKGGASLLPNPDSVFLSWLLRARHVERRGGRKTPLLSCLNPEVRRVFSPTTSTH